MSSQALVITAYQDFPMLERLIQRFVDFHVYIHIDKKTVRHHREQVSALKKKYIRNDNIHFYTRYAVGWGSINHLLSVLFLLKKVARNDRVSYVHIISGQDYPARNVADFSVFDKSRDIFLNHFHLADTSADIQSRYNQKHWFASIFPILGHPYKRVDSFISRHFPCSAHKIGGYDFNKLYKGLVWASMPLDVIKYICKYSASFPGRMFLFDLRFCEIPEELFLQTVIMNSAYRHSVQADNLCYSLWEEKNGSIPAVLDEDDYDRIKNSGAFFCRKIDSVISKRLIDLLD